MHMPLLARLETRDMLSSFESLIRSSFPLSSALGLVDVGLYPST